jgi:hypothetical protein
MISVTLYRKKESPDCDKALAELNELQGFLPHQLVIIDLDEKPELETAIGANVPVVEVGPYRLRPPFSKQDLQATIGAAQDRVNQYQAVGDVRFANRIEKGKTVTGADRFTSWFSNHYMLVFNLIFLVYFAVPFLAPVFMKMGSTGAANIIYKVYRPLCHQLAYRSWFLFGEQAAYPRTLAGVAGLVPYEQATGISSLNVPASQDFIGNPQLGYKVAFCERDVAIYGSIFLFGLIFAATRYKKYSLPVLVLSGMGASVTSFIHNLLLFGYTKFSLSMLLLMLFIRLVSGAVLAGLAGKLIGDGLAATGVLGSFPLGREYAQKKAGNL